MAHEWYTNFETQYSTLEGKLFYFMFEITLLSTARRKWHRNDRHSETKYSTLDGELFSYLKLHYYQLIGENDIGMVHKLRNRV